MHVVVAIPTFNRCSYLKTNIEHFKKQVVSDDIRLSLAVSNSASSDGTSDFLKNLVNEGGDVSVYNKKRDWHGYNYGCLLEALPDDADWVWLMGDDDYLADPKAVDIVCDIIKEQKKDGDFAFVHACQARRSRNSGDVYIDNVLTLCNEIGYLELLGWMSSLIIRKDIFERAIGRTHDRALPSKDDVEYAQTISAFFHSKGLLEELHDKMGAIIDLPLVEPQDESQTAESIKRWTEENVGERYINVMDDIASLAESGVALNDLNAKFFRYHTFHLWDRFMTYQLAAIVNFGNAEDKAAILSSMTRYTENWERIFGVTDYLEDKVLKKALASIIECNASLGEMYVSKNFDLSVASLLEKQAQLLSMPTHPFTTVPYGPPMDRAA